MLSAVMMIILVAASLMISSFAVQWVVRWVQARRSDIPTAMLFCFLMMILGVASDLANQAQSDNRQQSMWRAALFLAQIIAGILLARQMFRLTLARAIVPLIGFFLVGGVETLILVFSLKPYVMEAFVMPTRSMMPTIAPDDHFVVNKLLHPRRFSLIAYHATNGEVFCKRVLALPGEKLRFEGGGIFVNDQSVPLPAVLVGRCHSAPAGTPAATTPYQDGQSIILGADQYFVIGDNVDISMDSRMSGPISSQEILGAVDLIYWPISRGRALR